MKNYVNFITQGTNENDLFIIIISNDNNQLKANGKHYKINLVIISKYNGKIVYDSIYFIF